MTYDFKNKGLHKLLITNSDTGWVVGEEWTNKKKNKPAILRTVDRGRHWRNVAVDSNSLKQIIGSFSVFDDICVATNGHTWIVGDGGIIEARLTESSLTVLNIFKGTEKLYNLFCRKSGDIWATGENGVVAHYNQKRWQYQRLGDNYLFTKIVAKDDYLWLIGRSIIVDSSKGTSGKGILLRSTDNGITWKDKTPEDADGLVDIYFDSNVGWSVGLNGTIYSTSDGGESWIKEPSPTTRNLVSIFFLNAQSGWIAGDSKIVLTYLSTRQ
jgi:photosystem II stability/assembly factor-like uncharacterized protein